MSTGACQEVWTYACVMWLILPTAPGDLYTWFPSHLTLALLLLCLEGLSTFHSTRAAGTETGQVGISLDKENWSLRVEVMWTTKWSLFWLLTSLCFIIICKAGLWLHKAESNRGSQCKSKVSTKENWFPTTATLYHIHHRDPCLCLITKPIQILKEFILWLQGCCYSNPITLTLL